jgi:hypothetical protein
MTLTVQTKDGTADGANSYVTVAAVRGYYQDRGVDLSSYADPAVSAAVISATDFMDARYSFIGQPLRALQGTACPRYLEAGQRENYPRDVNTLEPTYLLRTAQWQAIERACCQLAYRHLTKGNLLPDPAIDSTSQRVKSKTVKAGPIETSTEYQDAPAGKPDADVPSYPAVDLLLRNVGLLRSRNSGTVSRG